MNIFNLNFTCIDIFVFFVNDISLQFLDRLYIHTLRGRIGKVIASHAAVAYSIPAEVALIYTMHEALRGYCP